MLAPLLSDKLKRAHASSWITAVFDIGYGVLTLASGLAYGSWWSTAVGIYYVAMLFMALMVGVGIRMTSHIPEGAARNAAELRIFRDSAWALLLFNVALTGVAYQMVKLGLSWKYPAFVIYAVAAFTFGNLGVAVAGIIRSKPNNPYIEQAIVSVNLAKAIVGMFFLATALLVEFGDNASFRILMESIIGIACMAANITIAVRMLLKVHRARQTSQHSRLARTQ